MTLTIENYGLEAVTYRLYNNASVAVVPFDRAKSGYKLLTPAQSTHAPAQIDFSVSELALGPGQKGSVTITVHPPAVEPLDHILYGGYIQFYPNITTAKALHVPYFGAVGYQRDIPIFEIDDEIFIVGLSEDEMVTEYNLTDTVVLRNSSWSVGVSYTISVPTKIVKTELLLNKKVLGQVSPIQRFIRPPPSGTTSYNFFWDGTYFNAPFDLSSKKPITEPESPTTQVTDGTYYIRVSALKLMGDMNNEDDWDSFMAGPFIVESS